MIPGWREVYHLHVYTVILYIHEPLTSIACKDTRFKIEFILYSVCVCMCRFCLLCILCSLGGALCRNYGTFVFLKERFCNGNRWHNSVSLSDSNLCPTLTHHMQLHAPRQPYSKTYMTQYPQIKKVMLSFSLACVYLSFRRSSTFRQLWHISPFQHLLCLG